MHVLGASSETLDYNATASVLLFSITDTQQCTTIGIIDDTTLETAETFSVQLSTNDAQVILLSSQAIVTISDDEGESCSNFITIIWYVCSCD